MAPCVPDPLPLNVRPRIRGRPRSFDTRLALERLVELFAERSYSAVTLEEMCRRTGLSRPSLHLAFGHKAEAYATVITFYVSRALETLRLALSTEPWPAAVRALLEQDAAGFGTGRGCLILTIAPADVPLLPCAAREIARYVGICREELTTWLLRAGAASPTRAQETAILMAALLQRFALEARIAHGPRSRAGARDAVEAALLRILKDAGPRCPSAGDATPQAGSRATRPRRC